MALFNKTSNGNAELKETLGFTRKSLNYSNIEPFMPLAVRELMLVIPKEVYDLADSHYNGNSYGSDDDLDDLVKIMRKPLALHAYRKYTPSNDLTHSDAGRQINITDTEKPAFEWQIDKDDRNMLHLAWEYTEILIDYLNEKKFDEWTASDLYIESQKRFIKTTNDFESIVSINNSSRFYFACLPIMKDVEEKQVKACFPSADWSDLLTEMAENNLSDDHKLLVNFIKPVVAFFTICEAIKRFSLEVIPEGIMKNTFLQPTKKDPAGISDRLQASSFFYQQGISKMKDLQDEINRQAGTGSDPTVLPADEVIGDYNEDDKGIII
jgi:hypothetical protein